SDRPGPGRGTLGLGERAAGRGGHGNHRLTPTHLESRPHEGADVFVRWEYPARHWYDGDGKSRRLDSAGALGPPRFDARCGGGGGVAAAQRLRFKMAHLSGPPGMRPDGRPGREFTRSVGGRHSGRGWRALGPGVRPANRSDITWFSPE